jgi:hypothetical protein
MKRGADSIDPGSLPPGMDCYFGYPDGRWPDYLAIAARESVPVFGLSVFGNPALGQGTDSEPGDASIAQAVIATRGELARGVDRPIKYCPASWSDQMVAAHTAAGIGRGEYRLLSAHYGWPGQLPGLPVGAHICGPATCGYPLADGTQWIDHGGWDESLLDDTFLEAAPHPGPPSPPILEEDDMPYVLRQKQSPNRCYFVDSPICEYIGDLPDLADLGLDGVKTVNVETALFDSLVAAYQKAAAA